MSKGSKQRPGTGYAEGWSRIFDKRDDAICSCPSGDGSLRWPCQIHPPHDDEMSPSNEAWQLTEVKDK